MTLDRVSDHLSHGARVDRAGHRARRRPTARSAERLASRDSRHLHRARPLGRGRRRHRSGHRGGESRSQRAAEPVATGPAPVVAKLQVKKPFAAGAEPQLIPITGANFAPGMTARLISPMDADTTTFPPLALERLTPTSFELRAALDTPGTYELSVRTPDGQRSNSIAIVVKK